MGRGRRGAALSGRAGMNDGVETRPDGVPDPDEEGEPIGPFPTWRSLYATVLVYFVLLVVALWVLSVTLDRGAP